jgi:hypothetical protein
MDTITTALAWLSIHPIADAALITLVFSIWVGALWLRERHEARDALGAEANNREVDFASPRLPWKLKLRRVRSDIALAILLIVAAGLIALEADDEARHWLAAGWIILVAGAALYDAWRILASRLGGAPPRNHRHV